MSSIYSCNHCKNKERMGQFTIDEENKIGTLCLATQKKLRESGYISDPNLRKVIFACESNTIEEIFFGSGDSGALLSVDQINMVNGTVIKLHPKGGGIMMGPTGRNIVKLFLEKRNITQKQVEGLSSIHYPYADVFISNKDFEKVDVKYYPSFDALAFVVNGRSDQERDNIMNMIISKLILGNNYTQNSIESALMQKNTTDAESQLVNV